MGEESTWFDYLPGLPGMTKMLKVYLGRADPGDGFYFRGGPFGDSHFSLTHVMAALMVFAFVVIGAGSFRAAMQRGGQDAIVPPERFSLRNLFEILGDSIWSLVSSTMGEKNGRKYLPLIGSLACFIFFSNMLSLIPGFAPPTATLKTNVGLALLVFVITHVEGIKAQGVGNYVKHFLGPFLPIAPLMLLIELIGHLARPVSLSMRLMGNMFADHKVVFVIFSLVPLLVPLPFLILGSLVVVIQTVVFCLLSMVYINMAVTTHEHDDHGHEEHGEHAHSH